MGSLPLRFEGLFGLDRESPVTHMSYFQQESIALLVQIDLIKVGV